MSFSIILLIIIVTIIIIIIVTSIWQTCSYNRDVLHCICFNMDILGM